MWQGSMRGRLACMVGGGTCMAGGCAWQGCVCGRGHVWQGGVHGHRGVHGRGACVAGGVHGGEGGVWQERRPLQWVVRILLEMHSCAM